jgi:hypothetical protein
MKIRWTHATIALAVVAAVSIAAPAIGGQSATIVVKKKKLKKLIKKEVARQIAKATGPAGTPGSTGATGPAGSAAAYALINGAGGTVTSNLSSNITNANVTNPNVGVYCIGQLPFTPKNAVATPQATSTANTQDRIAQVLVSENATPFGCAAGDHIRVQIVDLGVIGATAPGFVDNYFHVWIED